MGGGWQQVNRPIRVCGVWGGVAVGWDTSCFLFGIEQSVAE